jgi:hypothetical protein
MKRDEQNEADGDAIGHNRNSGIAHRKIVPQMNLDHFLACGLAQAVCSPGLRRTERWCVTEVPNRLVG